MTTKERWAAVDDYLNGLFINPDPVVDGAIAAANEAGLPPISVTPTQGKFLSVLAQAHGARKILELGTLGGFSTIWLARALPADGKLITLELDPKRADVAQKNLTHAGVADRVEVRVGSALETLPQLASEGAGPFDFIFVDANKDSYPAYLELTLALSRSGTMIFVDNVVRDGAVIDNDNDDINIAGVREFNRLFAADPRVNSVAIQTVCAKGYDGFALGIVL